MGAPSKSDLSHMNVENNPPGAFGEAFRRNNWIKFWVLLVQNIINQVRQQVLDNAKMTLDDTGKLFGINGAEADNSDFFRMAETAGSAIGMVPNLFMKMKNVRKCLFLFLIRLVCLMSLWRSFLYNAI